MPPKFELSYCVNNLALSGVIGVNHGERIAPQPILFDISLHLSNLNINTSNALERLITDTINNYLRKNKPHLLEKISLDIAKNIIDQLPNITTLTITIKKPSAIKNADFAFVSLSYARNIL